MSTLICGEKKLDKADLYYFDLHLLLLYGSRYTIANQLALNKLPRTDAEYINKNPFAKNFQIVDPTDRDSKQYTIQYIIYLIYILTLQNGATLKSRQLIF